MFHLYLATVNVGLATLQGQDIEGGTDSDDLRIFT